MEHIDALLDRLLADPLRAVSAGGALGYVGLDIPPDLLLAHSRGSCHLPWRIMARTPRADAWLESSYPRWARSLLEDWADGRFDCFDHVVFTRGEDVSQRLYYYVCELQRGGKLSGPVPLIFDIARIARPSSRRYTQRALEQLATQLQLTDAALTAGIRRANELRGLFDHLRGPRRAPGSVYEKIVRASLFGDVSAIVPRLEQQDLVVGHKGRVILGGSSPLDERLHRAVEQCDWQVVGECWDRDLNRLGLPVEAMPEAGAPQRIAQQWLRQCFLRRDLAAPASRVETLLQVTRADAAILWFTREDEALAWQVPSLRRMLEQAAVPHLILSGRSGDLKDGAAEEIAAFLGGLTS